MLPEVIPEVKTWRRCQSRSVGRSIRQRINLKAALDTRNVFLNVVGQDRIEQQWIFGRKQECSWETNLPYGARMHVVWTRSVFSPAFIRSPAEWQGDEKLV